MKATTLLLITFLIACNHESTQSASNTSSPSGTSVSTNLTPEQLGELGAQIKKNPNDAQKLLSDHGMDQPSFIQAVRKVAESPDQSKRYAAAYKKAS